MSIATLPTEEETDSLGSANTNFSVERFRGTSEELSQFIQYCWNSAYSGKMSFPIWTAEYLDWQIPVSSVENSRRLAVYDDQKLAGVLLGEPYSFLHKNQSLSGSHWSWLSIAPEYCGHGIAKLLDNKRVEIERSLSSDLIVSYRFTGSKHSLAEKPSDKFPLKDFNRRIGFWARPLNTKKLSQWNPNRFEGISGRFINPVLPKTIPIESQNSIRKIRIEDFDRCLKKIENRRDRFEFSLEWNENSLNHHLFGSAISQTIVAEIDGNIEGVINFHVLNFQGRTNEPVGIIDILVDDDLSTSVSRKMLLVALDEMKKQGVILALKLKSGDSNALALLRSGFIPRLPDSSLVFQWTQTRKDVDSRKPVHVLWR